MKHAQDKGTVLVGLEDDQVISVCADADCIAQVRACNVPHGPVADPFAMLSDLLNERQRAFRVIERDVVADLL
ncbi:MAG: hypothetical protein WAM77_28900 [Xanthobacteraceae bacterium]|jgi:hypothetical protein